MLLSIFSYFNFYYVDKKVFFQSIKVNFTTVLKNRLVLHQGVATLISPKKYIFIFAKNKGGKFLSMYIPCSHLLGLSNELFLSVLAWVKSNFEKS